MNEERLKEIRELHSISQDQQRCWYCDDTWPCDTIELANAYASLKRERDDHQMQDTMLQAMVDEVSKHDAALERERDELKAAGEKLYELAVGTMIQLDKPRTQQAKVTDAGYKVLGVWQLLTTPQTMEDTK